MLTALAVVLVGTVHAEQVSPATMFDVEVRVPDQSRVVQDAAFTKGLQQVLVRLSGDSRVLQKLKLPPAGRYVRQFRYDKLTDVAGSSAGAEQQLQLWVQYDAGKVETLLRENELPVWNAQRDDVVVWLAVRDGFKHYILKHNDESLIKHAVEQSAVTRGLPVIWPLMDAADRQRIRFADVWAGFKQPLLEASSRYAGGAVLAINLTWSGNGWSSEWTLIDAGKSTHLLFDNVDYATVISQGMNRITDELGARYALLDAADVTDVEHLRVELKGIDSVAEYKRAENMLQIIPAVKSAQLAGLFDDSAIFTIAVRTSVEDFVQRIRRQPGIHQLASFETPVQPVPESQNNDEQTQQNNAHGSAPVLPYYRFQLGE